MHDPAPVLAKVKAPILALNGSLDLQVSAAQNLPAIEQALARGSSSDVTVARLEGVSHLFQTTGQVSEYGTIDETFSPAVLARISDWLRARGFAK